MLVWLTTGSHCVEWFASASPKGNRARGLAWPTTRRTGRSGTTERPPSVGCAVRPLQSSARIPTRWQQVDANVNGTMHSWDFVRLVSGEKLFATISWDESPTELRLYVQTRLGLFQELPVRSEPSGRGRPQGLPRFPPSPPLHHSLLPSCLTTTRTPAGHQEIGQDSGARLPAASVHAARATDNGISEERLGWDCCPRARWVEIRWGGRRR